MSMESLSALNPKEKFKKIIFPLLQILYVILYYNFFPKPASTNYHIIIRVTLGFEMKS